MRPRPTADRDRLASSRRGLWTALFSAAILAAGIAAWSDSFHGPFIFDDQAFVDEAASRSFWSLGGILSGQRPAVQATLYLNYLIGGFNATGYHVVNLCIHVLAALALFGVIRRTLTLPAFGGRFDQKTAASLAFCAALFWLLHPLQTQAVTYIIQRMESLMGLFYLLTLYCFIRAADSDRTDRTHRSYWTYACVAACALGMCSKEVMVTAPLVVLLYDRTFVAGSFREALRLRWGFYLALFATCLILARQVAEAFAPKAISAGFGLAGVSPLQYARSEPGVILHYLRLAFWPAGLCLDYDWPVAKRLEDIAPGMIVVGGLLAATVWALVRKPGMCAPTKEPYTCAHRKWGFLGAWFFLILAPTSSIMPIKDLAFEHRMYLPLAALVTACVVAAHGLSAHVAGRLAACPGKLKFLARAAALLTVLLVAGALGWRTFDRNADYRNAIFIWQDTVNKRPRNATAWHNLGDAYGRAGNSAAALPCLIKALELKSDLVESYNNLGVAYGKAGRFKEAMDALDKAVRLDPNDAAAYCNRGIVRKAMRNYKEALSDFNQAIKLKTDYADAYCNRGLLFADTGRYDDALSDYDRAIALKPDFGEAYVNRANLLASARHYAEALRDYDQVIALSPDSAQAYCNRGSVHASAGHYNAALRDYDQAIKLQPDFADAYDNRAHLFALAQHYAEALRDYDQAIALSPDRAGSWYNRGVIHGMADQPEDALRDLTRAIALKPDYADAYFNRACVYYTLKDYSHALSDVTAAERFGAHPNPNFIRELNAAAAGSTPAPSPVP